MSLIRWFVRRHREIGWFGRFIVSLYVAAALNFGNVLAQSIKAAGYTRTHSVDGFEVTACYFGPPVPFYPRFIVLGALFVAAFGVFHRTFPRSLFTVGGLAAALSVYLYWWVRSYHFFRNLTNVNIDIFNFVEIRQVAYLYDGTSFDVWIALSIFICLILSLDRLFNYKLS